MKRFIFLMFMILSIITIVCLSSCGSGNETTTTEKICKHDSQTTINGKAATCTEDGLSDGSVCSICGETLKEQTTTNATEHTKEKIEGNAATCTKTGLTDGERCSVCNTVTIKQNEIPKIPHTEEIIEAVPATCKNTGLTEGKKCSVCNTVTLAQTEVAKVAHKEEILNGYEATCTTDGLTDGKWCSVCTETLEAQTVIPASHKEDILPSKTATCTEDGLTEGKKCSVCNEILEEQTTIPMLAHTYTNRKCTICSKFQPSEGLEYALINDDTAYMVTGIGTCTDYFLVIPDEYNGLPITEIGNIYGCNHILSIVLGKNITGMNTSAFDGNYSIIEVYNLSGIDMEWEFPHRKALHSSADEKSILEYSGDYVFMKDEGDYYLLRYLGNEEDLTLPATYKDFGYKIHKYAFLNNTTLVNVTIPSGVTYIGMSAFEGCTSLESIEIPETVTEIDSAVFMNCTSLEAIQLPSGIKYIGDSLFSNCVLLESITVPDSVEIIYGYAFAGCTNLREINIPSTVKATATNNLFKFLLC